MPDRLRRLLVASPLIAVGYPTAASADESRRAALLVAAARAQIDVTTGYDGSYRRLDYPGGDPPRETGVCTDVLIRAYRDGLGVDLQKRVHEDMASDFAGYPAIWGLSRPDPNIDHRRVPNLERFFTRTGVELPARDWRAGDIASMRLPGGAPHIGVVSDRVGLSARPLVIHNIGAGAREEDVLGRYNGERRFRYLP